MEQKVRIRDDRIDARIGEILSGEMGWSLPAAVNSEKGVSKAEKDLLREDMFKIIDAESRGRGRGID